MTRRRIHRALGLLALAILAGCSDPVYDASTPDAAFNALHRMIVDGRADLIPTLIHIDARDITYADGVTEASAIEDVLDKAGEMLGQLQRVSIKLHQRFPEQSQAELAAAVTANDRSLIFNGRLDRFFTNPFGVLAEQRDRLTTEDLGDGTAAVLLDGEPALGFGLLMREINGVWRIDIPVALLHRWRPETREEWSVVASLMLGVENSLNDFERELDEGQFRNLAHASQRAGRLLVETAVVQQMIYAAMKRNTPEPTRPEMELP